MSEMGFLFREARQIRPQVILTSADKFPIAFARPAPALQMHGIFLSKTGFV